ncbi:MAG: hypothetical protein ABI947_11195 [Chloroflexota bacterium]
MSDNDDLRRSVTSDEFETDFDVREARRDEVSEGRIFGLTAGERMILSIILFMAASVFGIALLFATSTIVLH